jgi:hypothetical protein
MQLLAGNANPTPNTKRSPNMTELKRTAEAEGALKTKAAKVDPPQHEHNDEFQDTTMTQARGACPQPSNGRSAGSRAVSTKGARERRPALRMGLSFPPSASARRAGSFYWSRRATSTSC